MSATGGQPPRPLSRLIALGIAALIGISVLTALGTWQIHRRAWKLELIRQVDTRLHAAPVAAPGPADWAALTPQDAYRRVHIRGVFLNDRETLVQASTELGSGYWVLTPLQTDKGCIVLVNRGFVPPDKRDPAARAEGQIAGEADITGLLRLTEPKGRFLRPNDPAANRWYSRDIAAIAAARNLTAAPYFIDADATPNLGGFPIGGLTVVSFPNNHLVYALTWYGLALLLAAGSAIVMKDTIHPSRKREGG